MWQLEEGAAAGVLHAGYSLAGIQQVGSTRHRLMSARDTGSAEAQVEVPTSEVDAVGGWHGRRVDGVQVVHQHTWYVLLGVLWGFKQPVAAPLRHTLAMIDESYKVRIGCSSIVSTSQ